MEKSDKDEKEDVGQIHLPEDLVIKEILPWLPVKALYRYKSISKKWYSSICSSTFLLNHTKQPLFPHLSSPLDCLIIQTGKSYYLYHCDRNDDNVEQVATYSKEECLVRLPVDFDCSERISMVGSCNGLVCLAQEFGRFFILWNPSTQKSHKYFLPHCKYFNCSKFPSVRWGFGYVSSQNDYKVVCFINELRVFLIYSVRLNSWRRIESEGEDGLPFGKGRLVNEKLYWRKCCIVGRLKIVVFDLALETLDFLYIDLPLNYLSVVTVMGGYLAFAMCGFHARNRTGLVLKKVGIMRSPKSVAYVYPCEVNLCYYADLIGFTKTGKMFVSNYYPPSLILVDATSSRTLATFDGSIEWASVASYVPSHISPVAATT